MVILSYLDSNRKEFGEVLTAFRIKKFCRSKQISSLNVFPSLNNPKEKRIRTHLEKCGREFLPYECPLLPILRNGLRCNAKTLYQGLYRWLSYSRRYLSAATMLDQAPMSLIRAYQAMAGLFKNAIAHKSLTRLI
jgi:hypothetical protein